MNAPTYNDWKLVTLSPLPAWVLVLLALGVLAGVAFAVWGVRREPSFTRRALLVSLRLGAGLAALFFLLEPGLRNLQVARMKTRVAVLVDRSASMDFPIEPNGITRSQAAADALTAFLPGMKALEDRYLFEIYGFDPELSPTSPEALISTPARAGRSDLLGAIRAAAAGSGGGKKLAGVLLLSDGADNAELEDGVVGRARSALVDLEVPVSTFVTGTQALADLAIERVQVDDFAFVRNSLTVEVDVRARGFKGERVNVTLAREGQPIVFKPVEFATDDDVQRLLFTFTPDQTGRFVYTVTTPVRPGEAVAENNSRSFVLKVIRDRVRVLHVVGRPSWDERYLRGLLRQDANIDLISFYILRTTSDDTSVSERELSLIPFPTEEIFDTRLSTFDVVIFQNFGYLDPALSISRYERNLARYVEEGGAIVMIGGDDVLGAGRAATPILDRVIPLEGAQPPALESFRARLTPDGMRHPITAGAVSAGTSVEGAWASLPEIPGANLTRAREGATVLLEHPLQTVDGKNAPLVAVWDAGRGRAMAIATDGSWYWAFPSHKEGAPTRLYERFWSSALRWLVRDPDLTTLTVTADPAAVEPGRPVGAIVQSRLADYQPAAGAEVRVELIDVSNGRPVGLQTATTGQDGTARVEFPPPAPGPYKLIATASRNGVDLGRADDALAVRAVGPELSDASVRPKLLEQVASVTGGRFFQLPQGSLPDLPLLDPPLVEVGRSKDRPLWDRWEVLILLIGLLGAEWFLRRRFGYV